MMEGEPHIFDQDKYIAKQNQLIKESQERRKRYLATHPDLNERQKGLIEGGVIGEGLTKEQVMVIDNIAPTEIRKSNKFDSTEIWVYRQGIIEHCSYFKDDILIKTENLYK